MGTKNAKPINPSKGKKETLPNALVKYKDSDYATQQKARFIYNLCYTLIFSLALIIGYTIIIQNTSSEYNGIYLPIIIPELIIIILILTCITLLVKGHIEISTHLLLTSTISTVWLVMWMDKGDAIARLDSVVFIFCIISMLPILISKFSRNIIIYVCLNIIMLFIFVIQNKAQLNISYSSTIDYIADTTIGLIFTGITGYSIFKIHQRTIERAIIDTKERLLAEEKFKESDEGYRFMFERNPQPMLIYDFVTLAILEVNEAAIEHYGYSKEEFLSFTLKDICPKEDIPILLKDVNHINESYSSRGVSRHLKKNGELIYVNISAHSITYQGRKARHVMINDITERILAEADLAESEKKYRDLSELLPQAVWESDLSGNITYANRHGLEAMGRSKDEIKNGINLLSTIIPEDRERAILNIQKMIKDETPIYQNAEYNSLKKDGTTFPCQVCLSIIYEKQKPIGLRGITIDLTEIKKAENELKIKEEKYRTLLESMNEVVMMVDNDDRVQFVNKKFTEILGYSPQEIIGLIGYEKLLEYKDHAIIKKANQDRTEKITSQYEITFIAKDGRKIDFIVSGAPLIDLEGKTQGSIGAMIDITERKKSEKKLRESEEKYRTLMDSMNEVVMMVDNEDRVQYINRKFTEKLGYKPEEILGEIGFKLLFDPNDKDIIDSKTHSDENNLVNQYEITFASKDGQKIFLLVSAAPLSSSDGKSLGFIIAMVDITEKKIIEKELMMSEEKYRTLMESMNEVVIMADNNHKVLYVNKKFTEKLGYAPEEIIGKIGYKMLHDPEDYKVVENANTERINKIQSSYELIFKAKDGRKYDFLVSGAPVENSKGEIIGSIGTMMDITEKKIIEKELSLYRNKLEILVEKRTEELETTNEELTATNEVLYDQRKDLEAALKNLKEAQDKLVQSEKMASLGVLAAGVAHEINNPLNFIYGGIVGLETYFNENLKEHITEVSPFIEGINVGVKRAAAIVTSLNHYSRKDDLPCAECNVHEIIDNCLVMLNNQLKNRIEVIKNYTDLPYSIICNEGRIHQVFLNIIANSAQAIDGNGTITIFTHVIEKTIAITIEDTGCGIAHDILPKITDPFFTTKDPGKGTGLGLSITYNIIKEYNGSLEYESRIGVGTKATVKLPIKNA
ncbi:MAG: PAS domain S-box protein [Bacteroidales bacterium]|nr:MAG: PAS domain S-box protein [Bacteroidales bacterium]